MSTTLRRVLFPCVLLAGLAPVLTAADAPDVRDTGGFFTPATVRKANEDIAAIQKQFKVDLLIESVPAVPPDKAKQVQAMKPAERDQFFENWALERARAAKIRGIYVLICKVPGYLQVEVGNETQKKAFTLDDRSKLRNLLLTSFKAKEYDKGLLEAVKFVRGRLEHNLPPSLPVVALNQVTDSAGFFTPDTVQKANADLRDLKHVFGQDIVVETIPSLPADKAKQIQDASPATRNKVFAEWLVQHAAAAGVRGIFILICKEPGHVQVDVNKVLRDKFFTAADADRLRDLLVARFKVKEFDQGLLAGLGLIRETFEKTLSPTFRPVVVREVKDYASFFGPEAVKKANADLQAIPPEPGRDVAIETFPTLPPGKVQLVEKMKTADREKYYKGWAEERAKQGKLDGVLVLITRRPGHVEVEVYGGQARKLITPADVNRLSNALLARFRAKEYDLGLADAVRILREKLAPAGVTPPPIASLPTPVIGQVKDYGAFFSRETEEKAGEVIREIQSRFKVPMLVETFTTADPGKEVQLAEMTPADRNRFYIDLMKERRKRAGGMDGIQILVSKTPPHLEVFVGEATDKKAFPPADSRRLQELMLRQFKENHYDDGLLQGVNLIRERLQANLGTAVTKPSTPDPVKPVPSVTTPDTTAKDKTVETPAPKTTADSPDSRAAKKDTSMLATGKVKMIEAGQSKFPTWMWVVGIIVGLLVLWIFIGILRALFGGGSKPRFAETPPQSSMPATGANPTPQGYGGGMARGPQPGGGYQGYQGGGGAAPQAPGAQGGGGGHGFMYGMLGGMFGAAAGNWMYDSFLRKSSPPPMGGGYSPPVPPSRPADPNPPASVPSGTSGNGGYSAGGDFGDSADSGTTASGGYSAGGDFGAPSQTAGSATGGDFGDSSSSRADAGSGGGDFDTDQSASAGGGDFDNPSSGAETAGGGDFGNDAPASEDYASNSGGGDFGSESPSDTGGGGDFGGGGGDFGGSDSSGGGDFGGSESSSDSNQGGDF